jgi:hypothetical protein
MVSRIKSRRSLTPPLAIVGVLVAMAGLFILTKPLFAEGDNAFPDIQSGAMWNLSDTSPDANLFRLYKDYTDPGIDRGEFKHVLKNEASSNVRNTRVRAYFKRQPSGNITININQALCSFKNTDGTSLISMTANGQTVFSGSGAYTSPGVAGGEDGRILQTKTKWNGGNKDGDIKYDYGADRGTPVCDGAQNAYNWKKVVWTWTKVHNNPDRYDYVKTTNDTTTEPAMPGGKFDGNFSINLGNLPTDPATGLHYVEIVAHLAGNRYNQNNPNQLQFKLRVTDASDASNQADVGFYDDPSDYEANSERQFGVIVQRGGNDPAHHGVKIALPFGMACNDASATKVAHLALYDVDQQGFGNIYMIVFERNPQNGSVRRLDPGEYSLVKNVSSTGGNRLLATGGNLETSAFNVTMQRGKQYMFAVINPYQPGKNYPVNNVLSLKIPTDSIRGITNCYYDLTPSVQQSPAPGAQTTEDAHFTVDGIVSKNDGSDTDDHPWFLSVIKSSSRPANAAAAINSQAPCDWQSNCTELQSGTQNGGFQSDSTTLVNDIAYDQSNVAPGTWICFMMSVKKPSYESAASLWYHSALTCNYFGRKPHIQVWGYDAKTVGAIDTSLSKDNANKTLGSWAEYGLYSDGINTGMASGSGLAGGNLSGAQSSWSNLTFANISPFGLPQFGSFGGVAVAQVASETGSPSFSNPVNSPVTFPIKTKAVYQFNGTLFINDDITYDTSSAYSSISDIPLVVIRADNVVIGPNVKHIDPWIVAMDKNGVLGSISTCSQVKAGANYFVALRNAGLDTGKCNPSAPLIFNGPVIAKQIYLYRTYVATGDIPAEIFNLRADNFLSSYVGGGSNNPVATTDLVTELPPRF